MGASAQRLDQRRGLFSRTESKAGIAGVIVALLVVVGLVVYREVYHDRIFPGVEVAGISVGGMTPDQARSLLEERLAASVGVPLVVEANGKRWELSRRSLGAHYDLDALVRSAFSIGRSGTVLNRLGTPLLIRVRPRDLDATIQLEATDWTAALGPISRSIDRPAVDARLAVLPDHTVSVVPEKPGVHLDLPGAQREIATALVAGVTGPIKLPVVEVPSLVRARDLTEAQKMAAMALSGPVTVAYQDRTWQLTVDELQSALILPNGMSSRDGAAVQINPKVIDHFVQEVASQVDRPARDARLVLQDDRVVLQPSQTKRTLDQAATKAQVQSAVFSPRRAVSAKVDEAPPAVTEADLSSALTLANTLIGAPIILNAANGQSYTLGTSDLRKMLALPTDPSAQRDQRPTLDPAKLQAYVARLASSIDRPALNARFQYSNGHVQPIRDGIAGQQLDQETTVDLIQKAATGDQRTVSLPIATIAPAITASDADKLAGLQLIQENSTSYAGSIPPRKHNVELAASMLNGVVVAPGQIFSFNQELGPQTLDRGFQVGYGIVAQANGSVKTVPSVGGGICQVSTTLFQPVFWAGYEIEERHWHAYWIAHYASHGYPGLDDTVDDASGLDFKFKNNTPNPILIQSSTDGTNVHFALYGTPPSWTVHVDKPVISNIVKTDRTLRVQVDPTLAPGQKIYTEAAEDGFTVVVRRVVDEGNGSVRELVLRSVYAPSHNVMAVGPGTPAKPEAPKT